jgi:glutathione-regulated potassium-efflux system ancillary protein KefG
MKEILIIFAHPLLEKSRLHTRLIEVIADLPWITINDLYQNYPDFDIDIKKEQELLKAHDIIIWQHPLYWYSGPAMLKQWQDLVLEHGWAYGKNGTALKGKKIFNAITSGGTRETYQEEGSHHHAINDFLRPFQRTAELCNMTYWPPFWISGTHRLTEPEIRAQTIKYRELLVALHNGALHPESTMKSTCLNDILPVHQKVKY